VGTEVTSEARGRGRGPWEGVSSKTLQVPSSGPAAHALIGNWTRSGTFLARKDRTGHSIKGWGCRASFAPGQHQSRQRVVGCGPRRAPHRARSLVAELVVVHLLPRRRMFVFRSRADATEVTHLCRSVAWSGRSTCLILACLRHDCVSLSSLSLLDRTVSCRHLLRLSIRLIRA
jgi:hypothetical protein